MCYESFVTRLVLTAPLVTVLLAGPVAAEQNWPQFRGPRGDGTSMAKDIAFNWDQTNNVVWKVPVPGRGRSSPVVLGDRIWLTTALERGVKRTPINSDDMQTAEHVTLEAVGLERTYSSGHATVAALAVSRSGSGAGSSLP